MSDDLSRQSIIDEEHLRLLSLGFMVSAAVNAFMSLFGLMYMCMGIFMGEAFSRVPRGPANADAPPPQLFFWLFGGIGAFFFFGALAFAALKLRAAFCLKKRTSKTFCMVIAAISCLEIPYGTIIGVFTFIVLGRPSVMRLFGDTPPAPPPFQPGA